MFDFIGKRKLWFTFSAIMIALAIFAFAYNGMVRGSIMNFGIDFTGGSMISLRFPAPINPGDVRAVLDKYKLGSSVIQRSEERDILIHSGEIAVETRNKIVDDLKAKYGEVELLEADTIGPVIGKELRGQSIWALLIASIGIIIYVSFRFEFIYAAAALLALYHDAFIVTGLVALLWRNVETTFVAAILTIMGYSINDTIVIFDRIRENIKKLGGKKKSFKEIVNISVNETMARSINTILTTIISVIALLLFGGETLKDFALVLLVGFVLGGYSSIFVAAPLVAIWESKK